MARVAPTPSSSSIWKSIRITSQCSRSQAPGELIHLDIKKLGRFNKIGHRITGDRTGLSNNRGVGWEFVHVCIDDAPVWSSAR